VSSDAEPGTLRQELLEERQRVAARLAALERAFGELVDAADLEPPDDEHDPDGTTAYERAQVSSLAAEARSQLEAIDRALAGDEDLTVCESCGGPIGAERMQALPGTRICVACAAAGSRPDLLG
jgi:RNA polymerase-binding transcription factor DksA